MSAATSKARGQLKLLSVLLLISASATAGQETGIGEWDWGQMSDLAMSDSWCDAAVPVQWSHPLEATSQMVLGRRDAYSCTVLKPPAIYSSISSSSSSSSSITQIALQISSDASSKAAGGARLRQALLWDCDPNLWQLSGIQDSEAACISSTALLRAACNQWLIKVPAGGQLRSQSCAPHKTAFASASSLRSRVLVFQAHWQLPEPAVNQAVALPALQLALGSPAAGADASTAAGSSSGNPALLGTFVGSGIYPPSHMSGSLQAFHVPASADGSAPATASLACSKRCTYVPLGKVNSKPVKVVGYSFETLGRAVNVSFEVKRGKLAEWSSEAPVHMAAAPTLGVVQLQQPFKLHAGDTVHWRCSYDTQPGSTLTGGYSSDPAAQQEQCTVLLHYWPRVDTMRGCTAALDSDKLLGDNMCSSEAEGLMVLKASEDHQFPMRRVYQEHSFPVAGWMGAWKATHLVMLMALVWSCLWGFHTLLSTCRALGPVHRRFVSLHAGQQRNVALYLTHLVLDTAVLLYVFQPMIELWLGLTETVAEVKSGMWGFTYLVACYVLELTWRRSIDTMLAIHHTGTIIIILLYAGELTAYTYRVANNIIVLAAFALMEQPTYVALLLKRMLPSHSPHVVRAAYVGYVSWFILKAASVLLALFMFVEDWHIMPVWLRVNFAITWVVAIVVQGWSGFIQRSIYKQIKRAHKHAKCENKLDLLKRRAAMALHVQGCVNSSDEETDGSATHPSCHSSQGELTTPLLRRGRFAAVADSLGGPSPFEMITTGIPELDDGNSAGSQSGCLSQGSTSATSARSSNTDEICMPDAHQGWEPAGWQSSLSSGPTRLRPSSSFVHISQGGIHAPQLQPCGSWPVSLERNLHVQGRSFSP